MIELARFPSPTGPLHFEEVTHHGVPVGDLFYKRHERELLARMEEEPEAGGFVQETYLGFVPRFDVTFGMFFIIGYDLNRGSGYHEVFIFEDGSILSDRVVTETFSHQPFYDTTYDQIHAKYPGILDLRLD